MRNFVKPGRSAQYLGALMALHGAPSYAFDGFEGTQATPLSPVIAPSLALAVVEQTGGLLRDRALDIAAQRHLRAIRSNPWLARRSVVEDTVRRQGDALTRLQPAAVWGPPSAERRAQVLAIARQNGRQLGFTHFGLSRGSNGVVLIFGRRIVDLAPLIRRSGVNFTTLRGRAPQRAKLSAWILGPCPGKRQNCDGEPVPVPLRRRGNEQFSVRFPTGGNDWWVLELMADVGAGPEVALLAKVGPGGLMRSSSSRQIDKSLTVDGQFVDTPDAWLAHLRDRYDRSSLRPEPALIRMADRQARAVCKARWAAHQLPGQDPPERRAEAAGFRGRVTECVALSSSLQQAWMNLLESPAHRHGLLDPTADVFGIGIERRATTRCLVVALGRHRPQR